MTFASTEPAETRPPTTDRSRWLLTCGVVAGPLFSAVTVLQTLTRTGFEPAEHPISLLSLGDRGWIQIANFVLTGLLVLTSAAGLRRVLRPGPAGTWGPILIGVYGLGLTWAGVFVSDPAFGFPAGTPAGGPVHLSWHGALHTLAPTVMNLALIAACLVFARRYAALGQPRWAAYCVVTAVADVILIGLSFALADFRIMLIGGVFSWLWASVITAHLLRTAPRP